MPHREYKPMHFRQSFVVLYRRRWVSWGSTSNEAAMMQFPVLGKNELDDKQRKLWDELTLGPRGFYTGRSALAERLSVLSDFAA
jgi:hypothetical protein